MTCTMCDGTGNSPVTYVTHSTFQGTCPRCKGSAEEPAEPTIHAGLVLAHPRSRKRWAVYGIYPGNLATPPTTHDRAWGIHRMKPAKHGGRYVWQIRVMGEDRLLTWDPVGYGTAWDHDLMESAPV
jgi:hypothetical protein